MKGYGWLHKRMTDSEQLEKVRALKPIAEELRCTLAQLALAWVLKNPNVSTVITGASGVEQVQENLGAAERRCPSSRPEILSQIEEVFGLAAGEDETSTRNSATGRRSAFPAPRATIRR